MIKNRHLFNVGISVYFLTFDLGLKRSKAILLGPFADLSLPLLAAPAAASLCSLKIAFLTSFMLFVNSFGKKIYN